MLVLLVLFAIITGVIGMVNNRNIRRLYEESYTQRLLLTNALMGTLINSEDVEYFANLLTNQDEGFKQRQVDFYYDRQEFFRLQEENASPEKQQILFDRLMSFYAETQGFKNDNYWNTLGALKKLKEISRSTYVYVMADTGLTTRDGRKLYSFIFDAEDEGEYSSPDMDGLGTVDDGNEAFESVFITKKQPEKAEYYKGGFGELYFVNVPILNETGDVVAVLGTDLSLDDMNSAISSSSLLFNSIIIAVFIVSVFVIFAVLSRSIARPLSSLTGTALAFAEGSLDTPISRSALRQRTEIGTLAHAIQSTLDATTLYLNSIPESLFIMNKDFETYFRNEQFIKQFDKMKAEEFMTALFPAHTKEEMAEKLKQENNSTTAWMGGSCFAVMLKEIVLSNMPENSILVIANDITDLMKEKEKAQAAAEAKSRFLSHMSHEMRTPMNAIIGMTKVAENSDNISGLKHCLSTINASSEHLLNIINDVLDMSKIEAGKLELKYAPMNIEKTLMKVRSIVADAIEKKKQTLKVELNNNLQSYYIADDLRLLQVLTNILSNAVKFTPEGGTITLTVENTGQQENKTSLRFSVSDTGIGMTKEQVAKLFNAFEQADSSISRKFGGTGLGLVISQSIIEKMGGHIMVESEPGAGTTFSFTIALESVSKEDAAGLENEKPEAAYEIPDLLGVHILFAEDIEINREVFFALMEGTNISTDIAENGLEAVAKFRENPELYDLIIMDIQMPKMDGYEATKTIREMDIPKAKTIPIIAMSANAFKEDIDRCLACGMNDHLAKPIDIKAVIEKIVRYLKKPE